MESLYSSGHQEPRKAERMTSSSGLEKSYMMIVLKARMLSQLFALILSELRIKFLLKRRYNNIMPSVTCHYSLEYIGHLARISISGYRG